MSTPTVNLYGSIASEIYDLDKPIGKLPDTAFYLNALSGRPCHILEPACGSGRTLVPLAQAGHHVCGFDTSADMLARAADRCREAGVAAELSQQSFFDFSYASPFDAIVLLVSSFTLIEEARAALDVLARFREALEPGGLLMIDLATLKSLAPHEADRRQWVAPNGDLLTLEGHRIETDWTRQTVRRTYRYERWRDHQLIASEIDPMVQRYWGLEEFRLALMHMGFEPVAADSNHEAGKSPRASTHVITWTAKRI